ncbi:hypothetical protein [Methylobacter tundripaludum]|uniref:Uncharacterized protein n=1 Tax=Methylobacter tundripaludum (strain ATCC BAA-1195 / DSM 17260 / SV96) TaxID=697282 RepID=G3J170_METTV|nr:hypothetical protein [Methylobacter tundripaludum]EGW20942.1 hypothetical protein Mettu_4095 [Methylobacter tundripaludum SV96]
MNARGLLNSTITLERMADFFSAEFLARCDFLKDFIVSYSSLLDQESDSDVVTEAKSLFQNTSFAERNKMEVLYNSSTKSIAESLLSESMKNEIKDRFLSTTDDRIKKNNLYIGLAFQEIATTKVNRTNAIIMLRPNFHGIGIDLVELWDRYIKHNK